MSKRIQHSTFNIQNSIHRGFTLVELLVTMGIFLVMTAAVLANYKTYGNNANFANASEDIVLALRQAQVYGVGAKGDAGGTSFDASYGVYFNTSTGSQIIVFRDSGTTLNTYDAGDTKIETITWKSPIGITGITCTPVCFSPISVTFKRPNTDAIIRDVSTATVYTYANITISNGLSGADLKTSTMTISSSGQISLK